VEDHKFTASLRLQSEIILKKEKKTQNGTGCFNLNHLKLYLLYFCSTFLESCDGSGGGSDNKVYHTSSITKLISTKAGTLHFPACVHVPRIVSGTYQVLNHLLHALLWFE
jgi:hypothetical protein